MKKTFDQESKKKYFLPKKVYTIIRLDEKAFHTFTKQLKSFIEIRRK